MNSAPPAMRSISSRRRSSSSSSIRVCVGSPGPLDAEVVVGDARDLRQVRDREHLSALGEPLQRRGDGVRGHAADAGVDLVEDERLATSNSSERESDARALLPRRCRRSARTGGLGSAG
jgi:hypothetical protein